MKNHAGWGAVIGSILGSSAAVWHVSTYVSVGPTYGCGMDKGFAMMGMAVFGFIVGGLAGTIMGINIKAK